MFLDLRKNSTNVDWLEKIEVLAQEVAQQQGCVLYDLEMVGTGNGRTLRIYIDKDAGVGVEDCSSVSKGLNQKLDEKDLVPDGNYNLEVSTPGLDRILTKRWHFEKVVGQKIYVKLAQSLGTLGVVEKSIMAMKQFEDVLSAVDGDDLVFNIRATTVKVPMSKIEKSKLVFEMKTNSIKKKNK